MASIVMNTIFVSFGARQMVEVTIEENSLVYPVNAIDKLRFETENRRYRRLPETP
jgi:hypothetical protein